MPEEMPERPSDAEGILLGRIENSIKNDGFPEAVIQDYLQNQALSIPGLRFQMIGMLHAVEEAYAACYFDILADIELRCQSGEFPKKEIADLSQTYFAAIRSLSEAGCPAARIHALIRQTKEEAGKIPTPYALYSVLTVFQEENGRKAETDRRQTLKLQEELLGMLRRVMELEQSFTERLDGYEKQLSERRGMEEGQAEESLQRDGSKPRREESIRRKPAGLWDSVKRLICRERKKKKPPATMQELLTLLKSVGYPPAVMQEVKNAMEEGVPLDEIYACVTEASGEGDGEQMAADALRLFTIRQIQKNQKKENS